MPWAHEIITMMLPGPDGGAPYWWQIERVRLAIAAYGFYLEKGRERGMLLARLLPDGQTHAEYVTLAGAGRSDVYWDDDVRMQIETYDPGREFVLQCQVTTEEGLRQVTQTHGTVEGQLTPAEAYLRWPYGRE